MSDNSTEADDNREAKAKGNSRETKGHGFSYIGKLLQYITNLSCFHYGRVLPFQHVP